MAGRRFNVADIDFDGIAGDLSRLKPPKLSLEEVLARLREPMLEKQRQGVSVAQMCEVLKARGIAVGERSLKTYLAKGELPGSKTNAPGGGDRTPPNAEIAGGAA